MQSPRISSYEDYKNYIKVISMHKANKTLDVLMDLYYSKLEENTVTFLEYEDIGNGYIQTVVKEAYGSPTIDEVLDYCFEEEYVKQWTRGLIEEEMEDKWKMKRFLEYL